jgi:hypothetical protein
MNHRGDRCTFEAILEDFRLDDPALARMGRIVRAADVKGQEYVAPEGLGLRAIAEGFAALEGSDEERLARTVSDVRRAISVRSRASGMIAPRVNRDAALTFLSALGSRPCTGRRFSVSCHIAIEQLADGQPAHGQL